MYDKKALLEKGGLFVARVAGGIHVKGDAATLTR